MNSLHLEKSTKTGLYVKCIPLKGGSCCSSGRCNRKCSPDLGCNRRVICAAVVYHLIFQKYSFLQNYKTFCPVFANILKNTGLKKEY